LLISLLYLRGFYCLFWLVNIYGVYPLYILCCLECTLVAARERIQGTDQHGGRMPITQQRIHQTRLSVCCDLLVDAKYFTHHKTNTAQACDGTIPTTHASRQCVASWLFGAQRKQSCARGVSSSSSSSSSSNRYLVEFRLRPLQPSATRTRVHDARVPRVLVPQHAHCVCAHSRIVRYHII
jgi:hypothetical protein